MKILHGIFEEIKGDGVESLKKVAKPPLFVVDD